MIAEALIIASSLLSPTEVMLAGMRYGERSAYELGSSVTDVPCIRAGQSRLLPLGLEQGERIETVFLASGDAFWRVDLQAHGRQRQHVAVSPLRRGLQTHMTVATTRRDINLVICSK